MRIGEHIRIPLKFKIDTIYEDKLGKRYHITCELKTHFHKDIINLCLTEAEIKEIII